MQLGRGVAAALRYARAAGFFLIPRPHAHGVFLDGGFLEIGADATASAIRRVVRAQLRLESAKKRPKKPLA
jgi:hypothetical protein